MKSLLTKLIFVMFFVIVMTSLFSTSASADTYGDLTYTVSNGEVTITDCSTSVTSVTIPSTINGFPVTSIGKYAFYNCTSLTSVSIGKGVTSIGGSAFRDCTSLTSIYYNAANASDLSSDNYVFYNAGQSGEGINLTIGKDVEHIPAYLFCPYFNYSSSYASNITEVVFEEGSVCKSIGYCAFYDCESLKRVDITDIAAWCNISFGSNPLYYAKNLYLNGTLVTELSIPEGVTSIGSSAFSGCTSLTSISIGEGVTSIGSYAFEDCTSLTSVNIPEGVTSIGNCVFQGCTSLTSINIPEGVTSIGYAAFYNCKSLTSVYYCGTAEEWSKITINEFNESLTDATLYYHKYVSVVIVPADCVNEGVARDVCELCSDEKSTTTIPALGHDYSEWEILVEPDQNSDGLKSRICSRCNNEEYDCVLFLTGDVDRDGVLSNSDITLVIRAMSGWEVDFELAQIDVNYDGRITNRDALALIKKLAGWDEE